MADGRKATLTVDGKTFELPVYSGTLGPDVIDVSSLAQNDIFTYDPGFMSTAACDSSITFIDGDKGELLYRGYPIQDLAENCDFLETCFLLLNGELPKIDLYPQTIAIYLKDLSLYSDSIEYCCIFPLTYHQTNCF